jgi:hypothetical protein
MPNNKLILRSVNSPWVSPFNDITTGSVLSWADVDNNFIYLKGEIIHSGYTSGNSISNNQIFNYSLANASGGLPFSGIFVTGTTGINVNELYGILYYYFNFF